MHNWTRKMSVLLLRFIYIYPYKQYVCIRTLLHYSLYVKFFQNYTNNQQWIIRVEMSIIISLHTTRIFDRFSCGRRTKAWQACESTVLSTVNRRLVGGPMVSQVQLRHSCIIDDVGKWTPVIFTISGHSQTSQLT